MAALEQARTMSGSGLSSDSEDGRDDVIQIRNYQPSLTLRASAASRESSLSSGRHALQAQGSGEWPRGSGMSTYNNKLYKSDGVSELGSPTSRPVSAGQRANVQTQMSLQAKRRAERMAGGMYTSNDSGMNRPSSPRVQEPSIPEIPDEQASQHQRSRLGRQPQQPAQQPTPRTKSDLFRGLRESYDPSAEDPEEQAPEDLTPSSNYQPKSFQPLEAGGLPGLGGNQPVQQTPLSIDSTDIRTFLMTPGPKNHPVQCYIVREKLGGAVSSLTSSKGANQKYSLYLEDGRRFLMAARKRKQKTTSNYVISLDSEDLKRESGAFFGKLRSNFVGSDFTIYDAGVKKQAKKPVKKHQEEEEDEDDDGLERQQLGCVSYQYNVLGTRGPRKMTAIIPQVDANGLSVFRPSHPGEHILDRARRDGGQYSSGLVVMHNKTPRWNEELNAYCLNFHGRVTEASVKNFQLVTDDNASHVILQFGKTGRHTFTMDYQYPMSALQAFCICLSSFDNKLACE